MSSSLGTTRNGVAGPGSGERRKRRVNWPPAAITCSRVMRLNTYPLMAMASRISGGTSEIPRALK